MPINIKTKRRWYATFDWHYPIRRRKFKVAHCAKVKSLYVQVLWFEVVVWYG